MPNNVCLPAFFCRNVNLHLFCFVWQTVNTKKCKIVFVCHSLIPSLGTLKKGYRSSVFTGWGRARARNFLTNKT